MESISNSSVKATMKIGKNVVSFFLHRKIGCDFHTLFVYAILSYAFWIPMSAKTGIHAFKKSFTIFPNLDYFMISISCDMANETQNKSFNLKCYK